MDKRILIIEDEELVRITVRQILEKAGYVVDLAANGKDGMTRQAVAPADLVITDIIMPEKDGVEVTIEMLARYPNTRVLAISGGGRIRNLNFLEQARAMGAHGVLAKPFTRDELLRAVATTLDRPENEPR